MKERFVIVVAGGVVLCGSNSKVALQKALDTFLFADEIYNYYIVAVENLQDEVKSRNYFVVAAE